MIGYKLAGCDVAFENKCVCVRVCVSLCYNVVNYVQSSHASWKVMDFFIENSRT